MKNEYEYEYVSECCGAIPRGNGDCDTSDFGLCAECHDYCDYGYYSEKGNFFTKEQDAINDDITCQIDLIDSVS